MLDRRPVGLGARQVGASWRAPDRRLSRRLDRQAAAAAAQRSRAEQDHARRSWLREWRRTRARQVLPRQLIVAGGGALASVPLDGSWAVLAVVTGGASGLAAWGSLQRLRSAPLAPLVLSPLPALPAPPPPAHSVAFPAVRRLEAVRDELIRLLPMVAPVGRNVADEAWAAAAETDAALRWQAARLAAVEPHRGADPVLMDHLYGGVVRQEALVVAVVDLVAASAAPWATARVQDATDALHGLAQGLREIR